MLNGIDMWNNTSSKLYSHQLSLSLMNHANKKKEGESNVHIHGHNCVLLFPSYN